MKLPITAIILTFNEEKNIIDCLNSVADWVDEIIVVDSGSTDATLTLISTFKSVKVVHHAFENYAKQRNWALHNIAFCNDWLLMLDADHRVMPALAEELKSIFSAPNSIQVIGFMASRRTIFMGKWIKHGGHYPTYHAILFKKGYGRCEDKNYDQHFVVEGATATLKNDVMDIITDSLTTFTQRHNKWSSLEAEEVVARTKHTHVITGDLRGNPIQKRRFLKEKYYQYPLFLRVFIYFMIRYFFRLGFLDGKEGLIFHFLQGFWFRLLVDAKIYERIKQHKHEQ